ncbi:MAG: hypothetical protein P4N60_13590 [Verrucomicrobiae bacterium]|nr:hypothetical protein [Verrucomicrobiae bacterium]
MNSHDVTVITRAVNPEDANFTSHPKNFVPVTTTRRGVRPGFTWTMPPASVEVIGVQPR